LQTFFLFTSHGFHMQTIWRTSSCWTHSTWGYSPCHHEVGKPCLRRRWKASKNRKRRSLVINPWSSW
jgi:hypothetical protein